MAIRPIDDMDYPSWLFVQGGRSDYDYRARQDIDYFSELAITPNDNLSLLLLSMRNRLGSGQSLSTSATTAEWNTRINYIPAEGEICIYTDYKVIHDDQGNEKYIPGIKIGDGKAYVVDLPFVAEDMQEVLFEHIRDMICHVTNQERALWNSALKIAGIEMENLIFVEVNGDNDNG